MATEKKGHYNTYDRFDPFIYIKEKYAVVTDWNSQPLKLLHNIFQSYGSTPAGLKVLDFGCDSVPIYQRYKATEASDGHSKSYFQFQCPSCFL